MVRSGAKGDLIRHLSLRERLGTVADRHRESSVSRKKFSLVWPHEK
jgi:hypothetical protein